MFSVLYFVFLLAVSRASLSKQSAEKERGVCFAFESSWHFLGISNRSGSVEVFGASIIMCCIEHCTRTQIIVASRSAADTIFLRMCLNTA